MVRIILYKISVRSQYHDNKELPVINYPLIEYHRSLEPVIPYFATDNRHQYSCFQQSRRLFCKYILRKNCNIGDIAERFSIYVRMIF